MSLQEPLLATVTRRTLIWLGHVTLHGSTSQTILQGTLDGGRCRGQQTKCWMDNFIRWTSLSMPELLTMAFRKYDWSRNSADHPSCLPTPQSRRPGRWGDWPDLWWCNVRYSLPRLSDIGPSWPAGVASAIVSLYSRLSDFGPSWPHGVVSGIVSLSSRMSDIGPSWPAGVTSGIVPLYSLL